MVRIRSKILIPVLLGTSESGYVSSAFSRNSEVLPLTEHQKSAIVKAHNVYRMSFDSFLLIICSFSILIFFN